MCILHDYSTILPMYSNTGATAILQYSNIAIGEQSFIVHTLALYGETTLCLGSLGVCTRPILLFIRWWRHSLALQVWTLALHKSCHKRQQNWPCQLLLFKQHYLLVFLWLFVTAFVDKQHSVSRTQVVLFHLQFGVRIESSLLDPAISAVLFPVFICGWNFVMLHEYCGR